MEFDYIIVGAGSAGCVLADRLSRDGKHRVLIVEAGGRDSGVWVKVPLGYAFTFTDPRLTWRYSTQPDPGLKGRKGYWPRGRTLGGSSSINAMAYVRGLPRDYEDWEAAGATGWNWDTARQTFDRIERVSAEGRVTGDGPLHVADLSDRMHPFSAKFLDAARDLGWPVHRDMNAETGAGLARFRSTVHQGRRWSAADAFLRPALRRDNVRLVRNARVEALDLDGLRATGIHYRIGDRRITARALGEVILSAGAINSPQLLQLSGIGPADLLTSRGVPVAHDLGEVGRGLQDHLAIAHDFEATEPTLNSQLGWWVGKGLAGLQYLLTRRGPLSVPMNAVGGFVRSGDDRPVPDMQIYCNPACYQIRPDGAPAMLRDPGFLLCAQPCRPTSRGRVAIASADPGDAPLIQPNSLSTERDRADAIRAGRLVQALASAPSIARVTKAAVEPDIAKMDDAGLLDNFRKRASTNFHPTCTCRMGRDASDSVLDARLRVHGMAGLRVVDASAFPNITSGNTNAPTVMLAMRAADLILEDAGGEPRRS